MALYQLKTPDYEESGNIGYNCTDCPSLIEILTMNLDKGFIEFKCLDKKCSVRKEISLSEYFNKMEKYKQKNINEDTCKEHSPIKNENVFMSYCLDCNKHLCEECLKTGNHINHKKNNIIEIMPSNIDLTIIEQSIDEYKTIYDKLKKEKNLFDKNKNKNVYYYIKISELILNTYNTYKNNYYNGINVNNLLLSLYQDDNINNKIIKKITSHHYIEKIKEKLNKKEINSKVLNITRDSKNIDEKINELKLFYEKIINAKIEENEREKKEHEYLLKELKEKYEKDKIELINKNEIEKLELENIIKDLTERNEKGGNEKLKKEKNMEKEEAIPLDLNTALSRSSYNNYNIDFIRDFLSNNYINNKCAKIFFLSNAEEKIFVIEYKLTLIILNQSFNLNLYIHIPILYPDYPPKFYLEKKGKVSLTSNYLNGKIDPKTFEINIKEFCEYVPSKNNVEEIINKIKNDFNEDYPVFRDKTNKLPGIPGKNTFNKKELNIII